MLDSLPTAPLIGLFLASAAAVVGAGVALARHGDAIAVNTGMSGLLVGMLLVAGATSLPEIVTGVSASLTGAPDLAIGALFGSSMANMAILAVVDLLRRRAVWPSVGLGHARLAAIAIALTVLPLLGILTPVRIQVGWIGLESILIVATYVLAVSWVHRAERPGSEAGPELQPEPDQSDLLPTPTGWPPTVPPCRLAITSFVLPRPRVSCWPPLPSSPSRQTRSPSEPAWPRRSSA